MRNADVEYIKDHVTCKQVMEDYGAVIKYGDFCVCPFHNEKTGSMKLYPDKRGYYCYGCHDGGDVIKLTMKLHGLTFKGAVNTLNSSYNLGLNLDRRMSPEERRQALKAQLEAKERILTAKIDRACAEIEWINALDEFLAADAMVETFRAARLTAGRIFGELWWQREKAAYYLELAEERRKQYYAGDQRQPGQGRQGR